LIDNRYREDLVPDRRKPSCAPRLHEGRGKWPKPKSKINLARAQEIEKFVATEEVEPPVKLLDRRRESR